MARHFQGTFFYAPLFWRKNRKFMLKFISKNYTQKFKKNFKPLIWYISFSCVFGIRDSGLDLRITDFQDT